VLRRALQAFASLLVAAVGAALAVWGAQLLLDGIAIPAAGTILPESAVFLPMAVGGALTFVFAIERLLVPIPDAVTET
jgi:TRAP-type C4-dicarboxylate transport system permease small subunit